MLFSQTAEYALRAAACLAGSSDDGLVSAATLSAEAHIPTHYLPKVMRPLVAAGLVEARRGRSGGFRLARHPAEITFFDVLDASGAMPSPERCAFGMDHCNPEDPCILHNSWGTFRDAVSEWAHGHSLADLDERGAVPAPPLPG